MYLARQGPIRIAIGGIFLYNIVTRLAPQRATGVRSALAYSIIILGFMAQPTRLLYITGEMEPFTEASPLSTRVRTLAEETQDAGPYDVRVFMPKFGAISDRRNHLHEVIRLSGTEVPINGGTDACTVKVASVPDTRVQVYFMEHATHIPETPGSTSFPESHALFFNRAILETLVSLRWIPDIVHGFGWQSALFPWLASQEYNGHEHMTHQPHFVFTPDDSAHARSLPEDIDSETGEYLSLGMNRAGATVPLQETPHVDGAAAMLLSANDASNRLLTLYEDTM